MRNGITLLNRFSCYQYVEVPTRSLHLAKAITKRAATGTINPRSFQQSKVVPTYLLDRNELIKHVTAKKTLKRPAAANDGR
jgi:hypothetical protein